jgi:hypothetical protein
MPAYVNNSPAHRVALLVAGKPEYLFGSFNDEVAPPLFQITNDVANGTTATLTGYLRAGNIPAVGDFITVTGTQASGGALNVTHVAISAVSINATTGQGTISFLSAASFASQADSGQGLVLQQENFETYTANFKSIPVTVQFNDPEVNIGRTVTLVVNTPANSWTGTVVAQFQGALRDEDSDYVAIGSTISIPTTAQVVSQVSTLMNYRFYRLSVSGITGGSGTICAKVM